MTFADTLTRSITKALFAMLFLGTLLVLSAHYRVVPFHAPESKVDKIVAQCNPVGSNYPTGVIMYGHDSAPHLYRDKVHVERALVDTFGQNGAKPAHLLVINMFCH